MIRLAANLRHLAPTSVTRALCRCLLAWVLVGVVTVASAALPSLKIPAGDAAKTLRLFARQAGVQVVYPADEVKGFRTNEVNGRLAPREALDLLLRGSGLASVEDPGAGAFVVRRDMSTPADAVQARTMAMPPATDLAPARSVAVSDEDHEVVLSPFQVESKADRGYRPANAVSATRIAAPIGILPMTVSAFTSEFIEDQKPYDLYDVVKWTPGVHQDNLSPQGWARYAVRGFTSASIQRNGFSSFRFIDTTNIARVEVVKGPYSLLYGQINPGGVINYITKRPEAESATEFSASVGSHGHSRFVIDATGPVPGSDQRLLVRGVAMAESIQEFHELVEGRKYLFAPSVQWKVNDSISLVVDYERFERDEDMLTSGVVLIYRDGVATEPYPGLPWDFSYAGEGDYQDFVSDALTLELDARFGESIHLRATFLDSSWDQEWRASGQGATGLVSQAAIDHDYPPSAGLTPPDAMFRRNRWELQRGGERSAQIDLTGAAEWRGVTLRPLLGFKRTFESTFRSKQRNNSTVPGHPLYLRAWDMRDPSTWDRSVPFGVDALIPVADTESSSNGSSVYGVLSASALDARLHVLGGYAFHEVRNEPSRNNITGTVTPPAERSEDVPQLGALYRLGRDVALFATYSESFLANTTMLRVENVPTTRAQPSIGRGWEAGAKVELWGGRVSGTLSAYRIDAEPTGITIVTAGLGEDGTTLFTDVQGGRQESTGFEAELFIAPSPDFQMFAAFGTCDAIYTEHPTNPALDGTRLVAAPELTANLWCKYTFARRGTAQFTASVGIMHVGEMAYVRNNPSVTSPAYTTLDLGLGCAFRVGDRPWKADILVKNATDQRYYASASSWGFPRHAIMTVSTRF